MNVNGSHLLEKFRGFFVHGFLKSGIREGLGHAASLCQPLGTTATLFLFLFI